MRIAVLIIGLVLSFGLFIQALVIFGLSDAVNQEDTEQAGALGVFMAFLWLIAVALVIPFPRASAVIFAVATVFGVGGAANYPDLWFWSVISVILAVMSYIGYRGKKKQQAKEDERDELMRKMAASQATIASAQTPRQVTPGTGYCRSCGSLLESGAQFCGHCGSPAMVNSAT